AASKISKKRAMTNCLFLSWLLSCEDSNNNLKSLVNRLERPVIRISFCSASNAAEFSKSQINNTLEETLLTCCPPFPDDLEVLKDNSRINNCWFNSIGTKLR